MLELLTQYLSLNRCVALPHVGTLHLTWKSAVRAVSERQITAPGYELTLHPDTTVSEHQQDWLRGVDATVDSGDALSRFGATLLHRIQSDGFEWPGVGTFFWKHGSVQFTAYVPELSSVLAERVLREDARHTVLVGDREQTGQPAHADSVSGRQNDLLWLAALLAALAALYIFYLLYTGHFSVAVSGRVWPVGSTLFP